VLRAAWRSGVRYKKVPVGELQGNNNERLIVQSAPHISNARLMVCLPDALEPSGDSSRSTLVHLTGTHGAVGLAISL
jgi:hypothetical protein